MNDFEYAAAASVDEAVSLLAARGERARVLAGGTDLIAQLQARQLEVGLVVDVKKIPELVEMHFSPETGLRLGAAVPCHRVYDDPAVVEAYPGLIDVVRILGGWQIQARASLGGNLCNASPAADSIPILMAYDVSCHIAGPSGRRTVSAAEFCLAPGKTVLGRGELLTSLQFPPPRPRTGAAYQRFIPRYEMDIAAVGAGSWVELDPGGEKIARARIALAAVGPKPVMAEAACQWIAGREATAATYAEAGDRAKDAATPITDLRGTAEYRLHLVGVLVRRTLALAAERARAVSGAG